MKWKKLRKASIGSTATKQLFAAENFEVKMWNLEHEVQSHIHKTLNAYWIYTRGPNVHKSGIL